MAGEDTRKVLIFTAAFGDGHNTAARNVRDALDDMPGFAAEVVDPYIATSPSTARILRAGYSFSIQRLPISWRAIYWLYDRTPLFRWTLPTFRKITCEIRRLLREHRPCAVITTYPAYNYVLRRLQAEEGIEPFPIFMVVTDSIVINRVWIEAPADWVCVANEATARVMRDGGVPADRLQVLGFPVHPRFEKLAAAPVAPGPPWRVLYLPASDRRTVERNIRGLCALPEVRLTVVTGRHRRLHQHLRRLDLPAGAFHLLGWTNRMPELLAESHLFVGKAGGAIVQETVAIGCPMIVSHVVPGQEEGNVQLLSEAGAGCLATRPDRIEAAVREAFADGGAVWAKWRENLRRIGHPAAARETAEFVRAHCADRPR